MLYSNTKGLRQNGFAKVQGSKKKKKMGPFETILFKSDGYLITN